MRTVLQILSVFISFVLYNIITKKEIVVFLSHDDFYLNYIVIVYLVFLANTFLFYGFYFFVRIIKRKYFLFKLFLFSFFVIEPLSLSLFYGSLFNA